MLVEHTTSHSTGSQWFLTSKQGMFYLVAHSSIESQGLNVMHSPDGYGGLARGLAEILMSIPFQCILDTRMMLYPVDFLH